MIRTLLICYDELFLSPPPLFSLSCGCGHVLDDSYEKTHTSRTVVRRDIFSGDHFFNITSPFTVHTKERFLLSLVC